MKYILLVTCFSVCFAFSSTAQKVKYKDLYVLLRAENYNDADQFLRMYLIQEPEDPHANYSMGKMLQTYMEKGDLLNESGQVIQLADSSILYYQKALELTTEKFVKKRDDDYYLDFRRRDMRTGKFEVKFSDVQLDMEERIAAVEKFSSDLNSMNLHFETAQNFYKSCQDQYNRIVEKAGTLNLLYFTTTPDDIVLLKNVAHSYDSSLYHLNTYRSIMSGMEKNAVLQEVAQSEIKTYPEGGVKTTDFYAESIELLNYKEWSNRETNIILKQIYPLKKRLISFDKRVQELHDHVVRDSLDKRDEVFLLATQNVGRDLRDYDPNSLPAALFNYRIAEINYHSAINSWFKTNSDSVDIGLKLDVLADFGEQIIGVGKLVRRLDESNTVAQQKLFSEYITARYESVEGLNNFIREHEVEVREDSIHVHEWRTKLLELDKIAIWHTDSISLTEGTVIENLESTTYTTVAIDSLEERTIGFYSWAKSDSAVMLAFGVSPSNRSVDSLYSVKINQTLVDSSLPIPQYLADTIGLGQRIWLMSAPDMAEDSTYLAQIFVTDLTLGPAWVNEYALTSHPTRVLKDPETGNLVLKGEGDIDLLTLDKYGEKVDVVENTEPEEEKEEEEGEDPKVDGGN